MWNWGFTLLNGVTGSVLYSGARCTPSAVPGFIQATNGTRLLIEEAVVFVSTNETGRQIAIRPGVQAISSGISTAVREYVTCACRDARVLSLSAIVTVPLGEEHVARALNGFLRVVTSPFVAFFGAVRQTTPDAMAPVDLFPLQDATRDALVGTGRLLDSVVRQVVLSVCAFSGETCDQQEAAEFSPAVFQAIFELVNAGAQTFVLLPLQFSANAHLFDDAALQCQTWGQGTVPIFGVPTARSVAESDRALERLTRSETERASTDSCLALDRDDLVADDTTESRTFRALETYVPNALQRLLCPYSRPVADVVRDALRGAFSIVDVAFRFVVRFINDAQCAAAGKFSATPNDVCLGLSVHSPGAKTAYDALPAGGRARALVDSGKIVAQEAFCGPHDARYAPYCVANATSVAGCGDACFKLRGDLVGRPCSYRESCPPDSCQSGSASETCTLAFGALSVFGLPVPSNGSIPCALQPYSNLPMGEALSALSGGAVFQATSPITPPAFIPGGIQAVRAAEETLGIETGLFEQSAYSKQSVEAEFSARNATFYSQLAAQGDIRSRAEEFANRPGFRDRRFCVRNVHIKNAQWPRPGPASSEVGAGPKRQKDPTHVWNCPPRERTVNPRCGTSGKGIDWANANGEDRQCGQLTADETHTYASNSFVDPLEFTTSTTCQTSQVPDADVFGYETASGIHENRAQPTGDIYDIGAPGGVPYQYSQIVYGCTSADAEADPTLDGPFWTTEKGSLLEYCPECHVKPWSVAPENCLTWNNCSSHACFSDVAYGSGGDWPANNQYPGFGPGADRLTRINTTDMRLRVNSTFARECTAGDQRRFRSFERAADTVQMCFGYGKFQGRTVGLFTRGECAPVETDGWAVQQENYCGGCLPTCHSGRCPFQNGTQDLPPAPYNHLNQLVSGKSRAGTLFLGRGPLFFPNSWTDSTFYWPADGLNWILQQCGTLEALKDKLLTETEVNDLISTGKWFAHDFTLLVNDWRSNLFYARRKDVEALDGTCPGTWRQFFDKNDNKYNTDEHNIEYRGDARGYPGVTVAQLQGLESGVATTCRDNTTLAQNGTFCYPYFNLLDNGTRHVVSNDGTARSYYSIPANGRARVPGAWGIWENGLSAVVSDCETATSLNCPSLSEQLYKLSACTDETCGQAEAALVELMTMSPSEVTTCSPSNCTEQCQAGAGGWFEMGPYRQVNNADPTKLILRSLFVGGDTDQPQLNAQMNANFMRAYETCVRVPTGTNIADLTDQAFPFVESPLRKVKSVEIDLQFAQRTATARIASDQNDLSNKKTAARDGAFKVGWDGPVGRCLQSEFGSSGFSFSGKNVENCILLCGSNRCEWTDATKRRDPGTCCNSGLQGRNIGYGEFVSPRVKTSPQSYIPLHLTNAYGFYARENTTVSDSERATATNLAHLKATLDESEPVFTIPTKAAIRANRGRRATDAMKAVLNARYDRNAASIPPLTLTLETNVCDRAPVPTIGATEECCDDARLSSCRPSVSIPCCPGYTMSIENAASAAAKCVRTCIDNIGTFDAVNGDVVDGVRRTMCCPELVTTNAQPGDIYDPTNPWPSTKRVSSPSVTCSFPTPRFAHLTGTRDPRYITPNTTGPVPYIPPSSASVGTELFDVSTLEGVPVTEYLCDHGTAWHKPLYNWRRGSYLPLAIGNATYNDTVTSDGGTPCSGPCSFDEQQENMSPLMVCPRSSDQTCCPGWAPVGQDRCAVRKESCRDGVAITTRSCKRHADCDAIRNTERGEYCCRAGVCAKCPKGSQPNNGTSCSVGANDYIVMNAVVKQYFTSFMADVSSDNEPFFSSPESPVVSRWNANPALTRDVVAPLRASLARRTEGIARGRPEVVADPSAEQTSTQLTGVAKTISRTFKDYKYIAHGPVNAVARSLGAALQTDRFTLGCFVNKAITTAESGFFFAWATLAFVEEQLSNPTLAGSDDVETSVPFQTLAAFEHEYDEMLSCVASTASAIFNGKKCDASRVEMLPITMYDTTRRNTHL